jgi:hypothetical protein
VSDKWIAGYGVSDVPVASEVLAAFASDVMAATGSLFMVEILINTLMCCIFL